MGQLKEVKKLIKKYSGNCEMSDLLETLFCLKYELKERKQVLDIMNNGEENVPQSTFESLQEAIEDYYESLKPIPVNGAEEEKKYTGSDLVSFGEYILSDDRKANILQTAYISMQQINDADLCNWQESLKS